MPATQEEQMIVKLSGLSGDQVKRLQEFIDGPDNIFEYWLSHSAGRIEEKRRVVKLLKSSSETTEALGTRSKGYFQDLQIQEMNRVTSFNVELEVREFIRRSEYKVGKIPPIDVAIPVPLKFTERLFEVLGRFPEESERDLQLKAS